MIFLRCGYCRTLEKDFRLQRPHEGKPRIAIFSYSGASGIVTADHMDKYGLTLAHLSPQTQKKLEELTPAWMPIKTPWITILPWRNTDRPGLQACD